MKKFLHYFMHIGLFCIIWCILNESFAAVYIMAGIVLSLLTMLFVDRFLLMEKYSVKYAISPVVVIRYVINLVFQIYKSGINSLIKIIYGKDEIKINEFHTKIEHEIKIGMLANAVTSTPGTVTIDIEGQELKILSLGELDKSMLEKFEQILGDD